MDANPPVSDLEPNMMVFPSSYVTKHGTAATMQIANISACRRIEHPDHSTRERKKHRFAKIASAGEWSSGRTSGAPEIDPISFLMENDARTAIIDCGLLAP
jgi:hypothetical protein